MVNPQKWIKQRNEYIELLNNDMIDESYKEEIMYDYHIMFDEEFEIYY